MPPTARYSALLRRLRAGARVVIDGWDKLIARPNENELYDLKNDQDDRTDVSAQHPKKVEKLSGLIDAWLDATPFTLK